jgi:hypothetical protein
MRMSQISLAEILDICANFLGPSLLPGDIVETLGGIQKPKGQQVCKGLRASFLLTAQRKLNFPSLLYQLLLTICFPPKHVSHSKTLPVLKNTQECDFLSTLFYIHISLLSSLGFLLKILLWKERGKRMQEVGLLGDSKPYTSQRQHSQNLQETEGQIPSLELSLPLAGLGQQDRQIQLQPNIWLLSSSLKIQSICFPQMPNFSPVGRFLSSIAIWSFELCLASSMFLFLTFNILSSITYKVFI